MDLIEKLADEFLFNSMEMNAVLNLETGEFLLDAQESLTGKPEIDWESAAAANLVMIPQITSSEAYEIRVEFAQAQKPEPENILFGVLNQRKPFRNFKFQLADLQLEDAWYRFEYQYAKERMAEWLTEWKKD